ncbi:MAG: MFS transporter [Actinobacteria bacterium]|nr:MFS transporter [Actinomycetota bacterium]
MPRDPRPRGGRIVGAARDWGVTGPSSTAAGVGLRSERGPVLAALMLTLSLVAIDGTVIATAVPSIVNQIGGFSQFPWLFSAYLLTQAVTTPLYGRYADVVGRRPVLLLGIGLFVLGSLLCGLAWSMPVLIAARAVQGLGAGAVQPMVMTIVADMYTVQERSKVQGYVASVWGASAVIGPLFGGFVVQYVSWRWVFLVNLPLGLLAAVMIARSFREKVERREHRLDVLGAALLVLACSLVILGLLEGGVAWAWTGPAGVAVLGGGLVLLVLFVLVERRAPEPVLPLWVLSRRVLVAGNLSQVGVGVMIVGLSSFVPTYVQNVLGTGPVVAGLAVGALTIGWPIAASQSGKVYLRIGFRDTALIGSAVVLLGCCASAFWGAGTSVWWVAATCFVIGLGMGFASAPVVVAVQSVVGWDQRGVVTSTNMFGRTVGSAVGAAVLGAVANATMLGRLGAAPPAVGPVPDDLDAATALLVDGTGTDALREVVRQALAVAMHHVFVGLVVVAAVIALGVAAMPRRTRTLDGEEVLEQ